MKKIVKNLSLILAFVVAISNIRPFNVSAASKKYVKSLTVSKKSLNISVGKSKSATYKVKVKGRASKKIIAKASNTNIKVTISKNKIKVIGKKKGSSKITVSTKGKNKKGKKLKKIITVKITNTSTPTVQEPVVPEVTKAEWISAVMGATEYSVQKELFDYNINGTISYSFTDISENANADIIETAVKYGIIPEPGGSFRPDEAADREFLAVTSVRAVGFAIDEWEGNYSDSSDLKYVMEDAVAVQLKLVQLSDNKFLPSKAITKDEKQNAVKIVSDIIESRKVDVNHQDVIAYNEEVIEEKEVTDYTVNGKDGTYSVTIPKEIALDDVEEGDKIVLPATENYPEGIALMVQSDTFSSDGKNRVITGTVPEEISEFVDVVDVEGAAKVDAENVTAVDGVATVEVSTGDSVEKNVKKTEINRKKSKIDGAIDLKDTTKVTLPVKEIETTVTFYLSELKYIIDFDKKGVNKIYIGLPNVLAMETNYKAEKNFSKKIGDIPVKLAAGFSANIEVYLEAKISGEITMDLRLSNNIGMQYYKGDFYIEKSCEPSLDMVVDADIDAGAKLQLALYWMKGIQKVFGKDDPRPVYNVSTKWGLHGDATVHIRNDEYTSYENLTCVDLGFYLYGKVSVGDGSYLGDKFNLTKVWVIFDDANSPLKGEWHIENGKVVIQCTYKTEIDSGNSYIMLQLGEDNVEETYQGTTYYYNVASDGNIILNITYKDKKVKLDVENQYGITILTNGEIVYYVYINDLQEINVYEVNLESEIETMLFSEHSDDAIDYAFYLVGYCNNNLYYVKGIDPGTLWKYDIGEGKKTEILENVTSAIQYEQYILTRPYEGDYWYYDLKSFDMKNEKTVLLSDKVLRYEVINNNIYMVIYKKAYNDKNPYLVEDCICDVIKCDFNGENAIELLSNAHVCGYVIEITEFYIKTSVWNWEDDTSQEFILNYSTFDEGIYDVLSEREKVLQAYGKILLQEDNLNEGEKEEGHYFAICDINTDGVLDLVLSEGKHILEPKRYYTYEKGQVVKVEEPDDSYPVFGSLYLLPSRGTYAFYRGGPASEDDNGNGYMPYMILEYKLKDRAIKLVNCVQMYEYQSGSKAGENEYYWNEEPCTAEEYQSVYNNFGKEIEFCPNSEANRLNWGIK